MLPLPNRRPSPAQIIGFIAIILLTSDVQGDESAKHAKQVIATHCVKCHGAIMPEGDIRLDDLSPDINKDPARWTAVRNQLRDGLMPPEDEPRISAAAHQSILQWLNARVATGIGQLPNHGNLVPHELLFGSRPAAAPATAPRVWRLSPSGYQGFLRDVHRGRADGIVQPFTLIPERGIKDFASLYTIDEASTEILLRNAEIIVAGQSAHTIEDGKVRSKNDTVGEFVKLMDPALEPTPVQLTAAIQKQFMLAIGRRANEEEVAHLLALYEKCAADGDRPAAAKTMLQAVLLRADAMYRLEMGLADTDPTARRMLAPLEIVRAVSLALLDRRDNGMLQAAEKGELATKEQIAIHVQRILDDPKLEKPGVLRFFREYFEYHRAADVFKDKPADKIKHVPQVLISDTDQLVLYIVAADKDVLRQLLTTNVSFVNYNTKVDKSTPDRRRVPVPFDVIPPKLPDRPADWLGGVDQVYGLEAWPPVQPTVLPPMTRLGILMQPSWLVAFSTNFDNDPVRRGRWVRERLLGGTVPDLPIGVVAQVPDERHRTFRDRLTVTRAAKCWKCHQQMDDLGLPFENFDHYGRFRQFEAVLDREATAANVDKQGKPLGDVLRESMLDTSGKISGSGDPQLDGPVTDPRMMLERLAGSERVRQVFIRHAFRYFLGRNESLADAQTLQEADAAYVQSGGSFKALLVSLLTSDAFLYRSAVPPTQLSTQDHP